MSDEESHIPLIGKGKRTIRALTDERTVQDVTKGLKRPGKGRGRGLATVDGSIADLRARMAGRSGDRRANG